MECPRCQFENREEAKFCLKCGEKLGLKCPKCGSELPLLAEFCDECGQRIEVLEPKETSPEPEGERKHVTVLFTDLTGYTAMSEKLDPEEVKDITSRIFGEISKIIGKYDGFIEKYAGDAVMALFGVPKAHEDDPIRAIKAAREIHDRVDAMSPEIETRIGQPVSMHSGINTGLVVTGEVDMERGTHGVAGDTINLASRLSSLAKPGEILVDRDTFRQAEGHFRFEILEPATVKGKADPVEVHKVLSQREKPITVHRLSGLRSDLVGRKGELAELSDAVDKLKEGKGRIFSICGDAGTGKSRLVEEFKSGLDLEQVQWLEGHSYAYAQNIPYFPLIDLFNRALHIEENDSLEKVREKIESGIEAIVGKQEHIVPYVGGLYSLKYPEAEEMSPEFWKSRLHAAVLTILSSLAKKGPTVFFLEDLHWADPSFVELLRASCTEIRESAIVLCAYRPTFSLFTSNQLSSVGKFYHEIALKDLSLSDAQDMLESLLQSRGIPSDLKRLVQGKAEGNPFYLEELVNSLIESETLVRDNGDWRIDKPLTESDISSSIHGLISGRLDRLEKETKRILQEASVIGRAFLYDILKRVSERQDRIDGGLSTLERLDLIRTRSLQPDLEYIFKHPLTQEVVYNGLLKKERRDIHEQIALAMEDVFKERLPEFYETLAFHFKQGRSVLKAVDYLILSGEKSLERYAVEEAHQYYKEAYDILNNKPDKTGDEEALLIHLLTKWALVFYYRGDFKGLTDLLGAHEGLARTMDDKAKLGMFYAWLGFALWEREENRRSYQYLQKALALGEEIDDKRVIGYACTWLAYPCAELGLLEEAVNFGERAQEIAGLLPSDHYLFFKSLDGIATANLFMGESKKNEDIGKTLLDYGKRHSNIRCMVLGHCHIGYSFFTKGDFSSAIECIQRAAGVSADPLYFQVTRWLLGIVHILSGRFSEAEDFLKEVESFSRNYGTECYGTFAHGLLGVVLIAKGQMARGLKMIEDMRQSTLVTERKYYHATAEHILGTVYFQLVEREGPTSLSTMAKNIGFLVKNIPFAAKKAEHHFNKAIEVAKDFGLKGILGQAYMDLGRLYVTQGKKEEARNCFSRAIRIFEECEVDTYLEKAEEAQASLG